MEERVKHLEHVVLALQAENQQIRAELKLFRDQQSDVSTEDSAAPPGRRTIRTRWSLIVLAVVLVAVPTLAYRVWHANADWSTAIGALNGLVLYIVGPGLWRLLMEGLFRAIPGVVFGQAARVAVDSYRSRRRVQEKTQNPPLG